MELFDAAVLIFGIPFAICGLIVAFFAKTIDRREGVIVLVTGCCLAITAIVKNDIVLGLAFFFATDAAIAFAYLKRKAYPTIAIPVIILLSILAAVIMLIIVSIVIAG